MLQRSPWHSFDSVCDDREENVSAEAHGRFWNNLLTHKIRE